MLCPHIEATFHFSCPEFFVWSVAYAGALRATAEF